MTEVMVNQPMLDVLVTQTGAMSLTLETVAPATITAEPVGDQGPPGVGVPAGGGAGQVLAKTSGADYATGWTSIPGATVTTGWGAYFHTGAAQSLLANTKATLVNNAGSVLQGQKPVDVATFYDGSVIPGRNGDGAAIGIEFTFTPSSGLASMMTVSIDIGGAVGEIYVQEYAILKGSGAAHKVAYIATAYMLDTWAANGGAVKVICDGPGSITLVRYVIQRLHRAVS